MKAILTPILLAAVLTSCTPPEEAAAPPAEVKAGGFDLAHVNAVAAETMLQDNPDVVVLDVRTPEEYAAGHLAGSVNVDFKAPDFAEKAAQLDKDTAYLVHCRSGSRSTASLEVLKELGFQQIYHLDGGFMAWEEAGKPVQKAP